MTCQPKKYIVWWIVFAIGGIGWLCVLLWGDRGRAWSLFLVNFLFFGSLAAGMVTWTAITVASRGTWMQRLKPAAAGGGGYAPFMLLALIVLFLGFKHWGPSSEDWPHVGNWLHGWWMAARQIFALLLFWAAAAWYAFKEANPSRFFSGWLILLYAVVFSLMGFDLVMPLETEWVSTLFGGYFFISGLYIAIAGWCLIAILQGTVDDPEQLADLANLMLAFCMLTSYLLFSQLIVIWYENMPKETSFLVPRMNITHWPVVSLILLVMVYIGPIGLLLWKNAKRSKTYMAAVSGIILVGMWLERWWLVLPSQGQPLRFGFAEITAVLLFLSAFSLSYRFGNQFAAKAQ